jgi:hypothetical protein
MRRRCAPLEPEEMVPPLLYVASREADNINGYCVDANSWDMSLPPAQSARRADRPAGFEMHPQIDLITRATVIPRESQFGAGRHSMFSPGAPSAEDWRPMEIPRAVLRTS